MNRVANGGAVNKTDKGTVENVENDDARHWSRFSRPVLEEGRNILAEPYNHEQFTRAGDPKMVESAAVVLQECYSKLGEHTFDNALANYLGLYQLIKHNPHFQEEARALRMMIEGEAVMSQFCHKVENL